MSSSQQLIQRLARASGMMQSICADLSDAELKTQFDPAFSPIGWHLGHVAWQEEMWVLRWYKKREALCPAFDEVFDAFRPGKAERGHRVPSKSVLMEYRAEVRAGVLGCLDELSALEDAIMQGPGLLRSVANHENQHIETVLAIRLAGSLPLCASLAQRLCLSGQEGFPVSQSFGAAYVRARGGQFSMGSDVDPDRWDNEGSAHLVTVPEFLIQRTAVTNGAWLEFVRQKGYRNERLWSNSGWRFLEEHAISAPLYWFVDSAGCWCERTLVGTAPLELERPVCHISWHEAEAFARFCGARLPTEAEWEWTARFNDASAVGMLEGVWEWTQDSFRPYPGFLPQAYRGYSEPWFGDEHKVARGGSWVSQAEIARATFRNWYHPAMRRAFVGVRLVKDSA